MKGMKKEELELLLKDVPTPISKIEEELKMPRTTLQKALKGTRGLSKKWSIELRRWVGFQEAPTGIRYMAATKEAYDGKKWSAAEIADEFDIIKNMPLPKKKYYAEKGGKEVELDQPVSFPPATPKTLDELKAMCPPELTGIDRSSWIGENRVKYGI